MTLALELGPVDRQAADAIFGPRPVEEVLLELVDAEECFFLASSAGMLFGLRLADGSRVALKAVRVRAGLAEARSVQATLHAGGFPCPRPIAGPLPFGGGVAFVDDWVEAPQRDMHEPARRAEAARMLARLVDSAPPATALSRALEPAAGAVFPEPHHPRLDFARRDGAWIDALGAHALRGRAHVDRPS